MNKDEINAAKHILIVTDNAAFCNATALYSYFLTLHKKVSIHNSEMIDIKLSFLPWYEKSRDVKPSSAEYVVVANAETLPYIEFFKANGIKINKKMATSFYASLMIEYENFLSSKCNGVIFALASQLINLGAEFNLVRTYLTSRVALSTLRLKAIMLQSMLLKKSASSAELFVNEKDLKTSGATLQDAFEIMKEALNLVHVNEVILMKNDENNKIIKIIKEI